MNSYIQKYSVYIQLLFLRQMVDLKYRHILQNVNNVTSTIAILSCCSITSKLIYTKYNLNTDDNHLFYYSQIRMISAVNFRKFLMGSLHINLPVLTRNVLELEFRHVVYETLHRLKSSSSDSCCVSPVSLCTSL